EQFSVRKRAIAALIELGEAVMPHVREALQNTSSIEAQRRLEEVMKKLDGYVPSGELLRSIRAVEVLEMIGTIESKAVLKELASGAADSRLTQAAKTAIENGVGMGQK